MKEELVLLPFGTHEFATGSLWHEHDSRKDFVNSEGESAFFPL